VSAARTLPAGWTGNDASHHRDVGVFSLHVYQSPAKACEGRYRWRVSAGGRGGTGMGHGLARTADNDKGAVSAAEARRLALDALRTICEAGLVTERAEVRRVRALYASPTEWASWTCERCGGEYPTDIITGCPECSTPARVALGNEAGS
jgi:hypothetical protein